MRHTLQGQTGRQKRVSHTCAEDRGGSLSVVEESLVGVRDGTGRMGRTSPMLINTPTTDGYAD